MAKTTPTVATLRADIAALKTERTALVDAPRARSESLADLNAQCTDWAATGNDRFGYPVGMLAFGSRIDGVFRIRPENGPFDLGVALAFVLGPEKLAAALAPSLDRFGDGPTAADRAAQLAEIDRQLLELEFAEERLIMDSEAAGTPIARRGDAAPQAVLGV